MDVEHILNYPSENDVVMESPIDEEIIQGKTDTPIIDEEIIQRKIDKLINDDHDLDDSCVLPNVSPKEVFK